MTNENLLDLVDEFDHCSRSVKQDNKPGNAIRTVLIVTEELYELLNSTEYGALSPSFCDVEKKIARSTVKLRERLKKNLSVQSRKRIIHQLDKIEQYLYLDS